MPSPRPTLLLICTLGCLGYSGVSQLHGQQTALPKQLDVPMRDAPPTLSLPLPKPVFPVAPATGAKAGDSGLPGLAPAAPKASNLPPGFKPLKPSSTNGQFVIHGSDLQTRTWFSQRMEVIADDLRRVLRDTQPWSLPIVISLKTPPDINLSEPAVRTNISKLAEGGFHIQLTVQLKPDFNTNDLRSETIRILLAERILRDHKDLTTTRSRILPDWLLVGVTEALRYRERSKPSALFGAVFKSGKVYGIEEILGVSPGTLDAMSRTIYEVSSCALVLALVEQPEGGMRMGKFLSALANDNRSDRELINLWFPGIAQSKSSLDKWWSLQMANLARPSVFESLDPAETAKALDQALLLRYTTEAENAPVAATSKEGEVEEAEVVEEKTGMFSRLFGRKGGKTNEEPKPDEPPASKPAANKPAAEAEAVPAPRHGLLGRLFGGSDKDKMADESTEPPADAGKKPEPKPAAEKSEPKPEKKPEPKAEPKPEPKPKETPKKTPEEPKAEAPAAASKKKPLFNRLFSKDPDKTSSEEPPKEKAADKPAKKPEAPKSAPKAEDEKKSAQLEITPLLLQAALDLALPANRWLIPVSGWTADSTEEARFAILGFGKKKDKDKAKEAEEEAAKADEKKAASKTKEKEAKPAPKVEPKAETKAEPKKEPAAETPKPAATPAPAPKRKKMVTASVPLDEYAKVAKRSDAQSIFEGTTKELVMLTQRAHPLFRPIIVEYIAVVADIAKGKTKNVEARLRELAARRAEALKLAKSVQDHLDWFEASENDKWSGLFDDYLRVPKTVQEELPQRTDPLSKLLDEAEKSNAK